MMKYYFILSYFIKVYFIRCQINYPSMSSIVAS
jgi:hypothetical protein